MLRRQAPRHRRLLATVLFTDIVGSTEKAAGLGDRRWRQLLARHNAIVRKELRRFRGREMDTAGDGFFAVFDQPADAIHCAVAAAERLRPLGIEIRVGIHVGQVEVGGPKVQGIAVNIGARVASLASPGEVLVSGTVRDALAGSEISFTDGGNRELRGIPGEWHLFGVEKDQRLLSEAVGVEPRVAPEVVPEAEERPPSFYRRPMTVVLVLLVILGLIGATLLLRRGRGFAYVPAVDTVARFDAKTGNLVGGVTVGGTPLAIAYGEGAVWVGNFKDETLQRVDPKTAKAQPARGLPGNPEAIAVGRGAVWITSSLTGEVFRIDVATNALFRIPVATGVKGIAFGEGAVWVANTQEDSVVRLDPANPTSMRTVHLDRGSAPKGIAVGAGAVWVTESLKGQVARIDPRTLGVTTIPVREGQPQAVAFGEGFAWVSSTGADSVLRIDPLSNQGTTIPNVGNGPVGLAAGEGTVWVANSLDGTLARIDPKTAEVVGRTKLGFAPEGVAVSPGAVWVTLHSP